MALPSKHDLLMCELRDEIDMHRKFADNLQLACEAIAKNSRVEVSSVSLEAFRAHIKILVDGSYMDDLKVDLRNVTHEYTYTTEIHTRRDRELMRSHALTPAVRTGPGDNVFSIPRR